MSDPLYDAERLRAELRRLGAEATVITDRNKAIRAELETNGERLKVVMERENKIATFLREVPA